MGDAPFMSLRFYLDTHIDKQVAIQLRKQGVEVVRCEEVEMADATDEEHLNYARENRLAIVTKDDDFVKLQVRWPNEGKDHAGIFFCPHRDRPTIGLIVKTCVYYHEAIEADAGTIENDIENRLTTLQSRE
jgi:hypothetical protein